MNDLILYRRFDSLKEHNSSISGDSIVTSLKKYIAHMIMAREGLQYSLKIFSREKEIWPDQCDWAVLSVQEMNIPLHNIYDLFEEYSSNKSITLSKQYNYEIELIIDYTDKQLCALIQYIESFRLICRRPSKQIGSKRDEIARKLELYMQSIDEILQSIYSFLEEGKQRNPSFTCSEVQAELPLLVRADGNYSSQEDADKESRETLRREHPHLVVVQEDYVEECHAPRLKQDKGELTSEDDLAGSTCKDRLCDE